jgi:hypothetical protein
MLSIFQRERKARKNPLSSGRERERELDDCRERIGGMRERERR